MMMGRLETPPPTASRRLNQVRAQQAPTRLSTFGHDTKTSNRLRSRAGARILGQVGYHRVAVASVPSFHRVACRPVTEHPMHVFIRLGRGAACRSHEGRPTGAEPSSILASSYELTVSPGSWGVSYFDVLHRETQLRQSTSARRPPEDLSTAPSDDYDQHKTRSTPLPSNYGHRALQLSLTLGHRAEKHFGSVDGGCAVPWAGISLPPLITSSPPQPQRPFLGT